MTKIFRFTLIVLCWVLIVSIGFPPIGSSNLPARIFNSLHPNAAGLIQTLPVISESSGAAGTSITCGNGVEGLYTQLVASSARSTVGFVIDADPQNDDIFFIDIGTGAAASETAVVNDIMLRRASAASNVASNWAFPFSVASGTRFATRCLAAAGANAVKIHLTLLQTAS